MIYRYFRLRNLAWKILIKCKINTLPIDIVLICDRFGVSLNEYDKDNKTHIEYVNKNIRGFSFFDKNGKPQIFYNSKLPQAMYRFTIAHELAHFLLSHFYKFKNIDLEKEANSLATRLLMPMCLIKELNIQSAKQLASVFNTSLARANFRFERYQMLLIRNKFYTSRLERKLIKQFKLHNLPKTIDK